MYKKYIKRIIDFVVALCALTILSPFLAIVTIWLYLANKGAGAFFTQERPGLHGMIFEL